MRGVEGLPLSPPATFAPRYCAASAWPAKRMRAYCAPRQRIALGWQAKPALEQTGASSLAPRVQLTQSSVHRAQFGGPVCTETSLGFSLGISLGTCFWISLGAIRGGIASSAAARAPQPARTMVSVSTRRADKARRSRMAFPQSAVTYALVRISGRKAKRGKRSSATRPW
jgi:hypothetical protein